MNYPMPIEFFSKHVRLRRGSGSMLTGLLFSESGVRYIPTSTQKGGRRYHYYTLQAVIKGEQKDDPVGRLPAPGVEAAVAERILRFLASPTEILDAVKRLDAPDVSYDKLLKLARQRASEWSRMARSERAGLIRTMLHRVVLHEGSIELQLNVESAVDALLGKQVPEGSRNQCVQMFSLSAAFCHFAQGKALKLVIDNGPSQSPVSREAIARPSPALAPGSNSSCKAEFRGCLRSAVCRGSHTVTSKTSLPSHS